MVVLLSTSMSMCGRGGGGLSRLKFWGLFGGGGFCLKVRSSSFLTSARNLSSALNKDIDAEKSLREMDSSMESGGFIKAKKVTVGEINFPLEKTEALGTVAYTYKGYTWQSPDNLPSKGDIDS